MSTAMLHAHPARAADGPLVRLARLVEALVHATAERLTSPPRDVPPEFFKYPLF